MTLSVRKARNDVVVADTCDMASRFMVFGWTLQMHDIDSHVMGSS
jgi:hypothetical protein